MPIGNLAEFSIFWKGPRPAVCAHCNLAASATMASQFPLTPIAFPKVHLDHSEAVFVQVWQCSHCSKGTAFLVSYTESEDVRRDPAEVTPLWPVPLPRELDQTVPGEVRDRFAEGSLCENAGALRGAAAMYRACVEELVKERGATGRHLYDKIENLRTSLGNDLVDALHEARMLGNDSVHDGLIYSVDEVADVAELIVEATEVLYVQPARRTAMQQARQQRRDAFKAISTP
jgi:hypothetical protein